MFDWWDTEEVKEALGVFAKSFLVIVVAFAWAVGGLGAVAAGIQNSTSVMIIVGVLMLCAEIAAIWTALKLS